MSWVVKTALQEAQVQWRLLERSLYVSSVAGCLLVACFLPRRYMAVVAFANECSADVIGIVAASSDATLRHLSFDLKSRRQASYVDASLYFVMKPPQECKMSISGAVMCAGGSMWQICATTPRQS